MRKRFAFATAIVCATAIITTIPFNGFILQSRAVAQQQQINTNTSSSSLNTNTSTSNPLPLKTIFKQDIRYVLIGVAMSLVYERISHLS